LVLDPQEIENNEYDRLRAAPVHSGEEFFELQSAIGHDDQFASENTGRQLTGAVTDFGKGAGEILSVAALETDSVPRLEQDAPKPIPLGFIQPAVPRRKPLLKTGQLGRNGVAKHPSSMSREAKPLSLSAMKRDNPGGQTAVDEGWCGPEASSKDRAECCRRGFAPYPARVERQWNFILIFITSTS
jgi:hypothetical protein